MLSGSLSLTAAGQQAAQKTHRTSKKSRKKIVKRPPPPSPKAIGAAGLIAIAKHDFEQGNFESAAKNAANAAIKAPILNDYAHYYRAQAEYKLKNYGEAAKSVTQVFNQQPLSPFVRPADAIAVTADLDSDNPKQAFELVVDTSTAFPNRKPRYCWRAAFRQTAIWRKPPNTTIASITTTRRPKKPSTLVTHCLMLSSAWAMPILP